jgi:small ligand-binding sensory domain FIST
VPFASSISEHPVTAYATGEVCGAVLEAIGPHPDLAVVFTTLAHAGALEDVVVAVNEVLKPSVVVGAASDSIVGVGREVEGGPAVSLWAGRWGPVVPVRITADRSGIQGIPTDLPFEPAALVLVGDPFSTPPDDLVAAVAGVYPTLPIVGGMASGARGPGGSRVSLGATVYSSGAVGALIGPGAEVSPVVSQGCRPIGHPYVVTEGSGQIIRQLAGQPALTRLDEIAATLDPDEVRAANSGGLFLGLVIDERKPDFETGDFLIRHVLGGDREAGSIAIDDEVEVGTTVQFHVRDAKAAHDDLEGLLVRHEVGADAALLFTCNGRGIRLFGTPDHDAELVQSRFGPVPTAGMFAAGELGPIGGRNQLHSFTASLLLLRERA